MLTCINKNSVEYQSLKEKAGISEKLLEAVCRAFVEEYERFPRLDEIPMVNSEPAIRKSLRVNSNNGTSISQILDYTQTESTEEATIVLNREFTDLETEIIPLNKEAIVEITHRPVDNNFEERTPVEIDEDPDSIQVFGNAIQKLASLYGIKFHEITNSDLATDEWKQRIPDSHAVNAFIYNGEVYINTSVSSVDAPLHEIMHLLVGSIRFTNPQLYQQLISLSEQFSNYEVLAQDYIGRSKNDVNEEIFVTEVSKMLTGLPTELSRLPSSIKYEITYNIKRVLDTILMGQDSVKTISDGRLFNMSLKQIAAEVNSMAMTNQFHGTMNVEGSELHRILNNRKADLIKQNQLQEVCE